MPPSRIPKKFLSLQNDEYHILKSDPSSSTFQEVNSLGVLHIRVKKASAPNSVGGWWLLVVESQDPPQLAANGRVISFPDDEIYMVKRKKGLSRNFSIEIFGY